MCDPLHVRAALNPPDVGNGTAAGSSDRILIEAAFSPCPNCVACPDGVGMTVGGQIPTDDQASRPARGRIESKCCSKICLGLADGNNRSTRLVWTLDVDGRVSQSIKVDIRKRASQGSRSGASLERQ
jgi:hypothetical protein